MDLQNVFGDEDSGMTTEFLGFGIPGLGLPLGDLNLVEKSGSPGRNDMERSDSLTRKRSRDLGVENEVWYNQITHTRTHTRARAVNQVEYVFDIQYSAWRWEKWRDRFWRTGVRNESFFKKTLQLIFQRKRFRALEIFIIFPQKLSFKRHVQGRKSGAAKGTA